MIQKLKGNYLLIAILLLASVLRFYHIDYQSIWLDEIHTINEANPKASFSDLYTIIMGGEQIPPFYFYSLYFLFKVFGYTTFVARMYSAIIGIISVYSIYLLGKELINKKVGLIAALLLTVNSFQIYYSQEARPYIFLLLFTILSFYSLLKFIKEPGIKKGVLYGIMSGLMISSHFFGLFVLFSQYLILLFFLIISSKENQKKFFINAFLSGIIALILFIPAIKMLINVSNINEFWIPAPTVDVYTLIFKEFFNNSELILTLIGLLFVIYFIRLSNEKDTKINYYSILENKIIFSFLIVIPWIVVVILIPLVRSYLTIPMIISRYFIVVLPAVILIIAIAIDSFKNRVILTGIVLMFTIYSVTDIIIVKNYYNNVNKAQFREATDFIIKNNVKKETVVSSLGWYMPYFLQNKKVNFEVIDKSLDTYLSDIEQDSTKIKPFWYIDAFGRDYKPSDISLAFINKYFYIENNYDGFQAWTKHFILLKDISTTVDISKFKELKEKNGSDFVFNFDAFEKNDKLLKINGWAFFENQNAVKTKIDLLLIKDGIAIRMPTEKVSRPDVTAASKSNLNQDNAGFAANYDLTKLSPGKYQIGIYLKNQDTKREGLQLTDKIIEK